ncbi:hypothetical protein CM240_2769 [Clostridium bornimense]|uniref:Beta-xylanase n=1 Tax=Clostridium bornimense TaxID=1216932 RepID=W6RZ41_9CLOT|nr:endo-1,4-beta-xylanase [Clostridium bornimense]CDM69886.1 hypothetical protein CM240_2769 [Clostridium bornimense]
MKKIISILCTMLMLIGFLDGISYSVLASSSKTLDDGWYYIKNVNAQKYLQVKDNKGKNSQNVEIGKGSGAKGQKWYLKNVGNGYVTLKSDLGNYMLDVECGENKDGANIQIYDGYSGKSQQFTIDTTSSKGVYTIATKSSNGKRVLDAERKGTADGTNVLQWKYGKDKKNQQWKFEVIKSSSSNTNDNNTNSNNNTTTVSKDNLKGAYGNIFGKVGSAVTLAQLQDSKSLDFIKKHYNSITMENEMKPDALLGSSAKKITVAEAKKKGYIIPSGYTEQYVPEINYTNIDKALKIAKDNNLSVRFHTLVWHKQTPSWFFKSNFDNSKGYVSKSVMDARLEYYIKNIMTHVYSSSNGSVVYAWDVVNEYLHNSDSGTSDWTRIYGDEGTKPTYVKKAFQFANDILKEYNVSSKVKLFYNDYNTYQVADKIVSMISYINSNGKVCDGVGMQSHLGLTWPSISYVEEAVQKFTNAGFEIQVTELDVSIGKGNSISAKEQEQAKYYSDLMKMLISKKKSGANITGLTYWGLSDKTSWIKDVSPLLFSDLDNPKKAYYSVIEASSTY